MDDDKLLSQARAVEKRILQFKQFREDLIQSSYLLDNQLLTMSNQLSKLNLEIGDMQNKKIELDETKNKLETDADQLTDKIKQYTFLKAHLDVLNQRKSLLEENTLKKGLELEEETLKVKLDNVWKYFHDKNSKLDEEIKDRELKLAKRRNSVSQMYEKESAKYKKSIEKLKDENSILEKKLNLISKFQK